MIVTLSELPDIRSKHEGETIAFAGGCFDILHVGHIGYLRMVKNLADVAVIAVSSDARIKERKGPQRPINNEIARVTMMDSIRYVDYTLIAPEPSESADEQPVPSIQVMRLLQPDLFITQDSRWVAYEDQINACGTRLIYDSTPPIASTTGIIETILNTYANSQ